MAYRMLLNVLITTTILKNLFLLHLECKMYDNEFSKMMMNLVSQ